METANLTFSIIIPTYNRPEILSSCLETLAKLEYPPDLFEVIVVDDGSPVSLASVVEPFAEKIRIVLLSRKNGGPAAARNSGIAAAKGKYLAFTDDDCMPDRCWLKELELCFERNPAVMVGGRTVNALVGNPYSIASQMIVDFAYAHYNSDPLKARFFASNNMAVPAEALRGIGCFNPVLRTAEDRDVCDRWVASGNRMVHEQKAVVYHAHNLSLMQFWRQHLSYGRGALKFNRAHALRSPESSTFEAGFYARLPGYILRGISRVPMKQTPILLSLMITWFVANTLGFMLETLRYLGFPRNRVEARDN